MTSLLRYSLLFLCSILIHAPALSANQATGVRTQTISYETDEVELTAVCHLAGDNHVIVFLPSMFAPLDDQEKYTEEIAQDGLSACFSHVLTDLFLPMENRYYNDIPLDAMLALLKNIEQQTAKRVYFVAHGSGSRIAYKLAHLSLHSTPARRSILSGMILLSPNLLSGTPEPGQPQQYMSILHEQSVPVFIFQPVYSPHHWHLDKLIGIIEKSGTRVRYQQMPDVRDGYALREDRTAKEEQLRDQAATLFRNAIQQISEPARNKQ